jgi:hypothetical protein
MSENNQDTPLPMNVAEDGWDDVERTLQANDADAATMDERARCEAMVQGELERGRLRGVPETSGVMIILHRIALAISSG